MTISEAKRLQAQCTVPVPVPQTPTEAEAGARLGAQHMHSATHASDIDWLRPLYDDNYFRRSQDNTR